MNLSSSESALESRELLKQSIAFIGSHQLSAKPVNYTVCYEYFLGNQPSLKKAINQAISNKTPLTDQMMENWFEAYLSDYNLTSLRQSQADLMEIITTLAESTSMAEESVTQFGDTLTSSERQLVDPNSSLEAIVTHLLASTKSTQASMELMRQQIRDSKEEIAALRERLEKANEEALLDPLTGLANRKGLASAFENALQAVNGPKSYPCIAMIDIDHFKKINDTYGHLLGDKVIKVVGETLRRHIKGKDTAARYGGEEFCVLLPETELRDAVKLTDNIRQAVENTRIKRASDQEEIGRVTISIGVARYKPEEPISNLVERADTALYQAKAEGRNRVTFV